MANYVIWLDSEKAQIFNLTTKGPVKSHLEKKSINHHTHDKHHNHTDPATDHFFHDLSNTIKDAEEILLIGPGLAKTHFKTYLENHHLAALAKKIIGTENSDHPTDNQILATARKFFQKYDLFNHPVA